MDTQMIIVSWPDVCISLGLVAVSVGLIISQGFGIHKDIMWGSFRSLLQLTILGYVLLYVFKITSLFILIGILVVMALVAAHTGRGRIKRPFPGALTILWFSIMAGSFFTVAFTTLLTMHNPLALTPQYLIPMAGMMIGNTLNGLSLGAERLKGELASRRDRVECLLAFGATADIAVKDCVRSAFAAGMIPTINSLMVMGLVQIPGIMTGQVLAGLDPLIAARYQLIILFMIVAAKTITLSIGLKFGARKYFTEAHQLRSELI